MILNPLASWIISFVGSLNVISVAGIMEYIELCFEVLKVVCYLIPIYAMAPMITISLSIVALKIGLAILRLIIDIVPLW